MTKMRKSNIELLRIVAMGLIVLSHYATHSPARSYSDGFVGNVVLDCLSLGVLGVDLFVMITGYFVSVSGFRSSSFFRTLVKTYAYGLLLATVAFLFLGASPLVCARTLVPGSIGTQQWFIAPYLLMYLFAPVLNYLLHGVSRDSLKRLLILSAVCFSVLPGLFKIDFMMSRFVWFCFLYAVAAYYRMYAFDIIRAHAGSLFAGSIAIALGLTIVARLVGGYIPFVGSHATFFLAAYSPLLLIASLALFELFSRFEIQNDLVNKIASATFGVYLIHDNELMRDVVWSPVAALQGFGILGGLAYTVLVYLTCSVLDLTLSAVARCILRKMSFVVRIREAVYPRMQAFAALECASLDACAPSANGRRERACHASRSFINFGWENREQ